MNNINSIDTVNAAATAIVSAESRVQPQPLEQKRRWKQYFTCFGLDRNKKRIGHAVLVPERAAVTSGAPIHPVEESALVHPNLIVRPFIAVAPPSSPASFVNAELHSSAKLNEGLLSLTSLSANVYSPRGPPSAFVVGPYANETQLVSPPVFSAFTTQPSTAPYTPPPEQVQMTTPSSPDVPYAKLLTSLDPSRRASGNNQKYLVSHHELQSYPGSPGGGNLISPGSVLSNSGTSSPLPDKRAPKLLGFEYFTTRKWGSRLGSGAVTPDGTGLGSRLGSGSVTPDAAGMHSRLGSGAVTPDSMGRASRLGSGTVTPNGTSLHSMPGSSGLTLDATETASTVLGSPSIPIPESELENEVPIIDHRVSFELTGEDVARCLEFDRVASLRFVSGATGGFGIYDNILSENAIEDDHALKMNQSLLPPKEFNFDNTSEMNLGTEVQHNESWSFFPILRPGAN